MLKIHIPSRSFYNESKNMFIDVSETNLKLEHSLISLSKWESKIEKPFMSSKKTKEEMEFYFECMSLNDGVDQMVFKSFDNGIYSKIVDYIEAPMTATTINDQNNGMNRDIITSEIIYYWMIKLNIPFECQKWHLNRLITLIRVCSIKDGPQKKMSKREILEQNRRLNEARKKKAKTKG